MTRPAVDGEDDLGDPRPGDGIADRAVHRLGAAVDLDEAGGRALVLLVDRDALGDAVGQGAAPLADLGGLVEHGPGALVPQELPAEGDGVHPHPPGQLVDDELVGAAHVGE